MKLKTPFHLRLLSPFKVVLLGLITLFAFASSNAHAGLTLAQAIQAFQEFPGSNPGSRERTAPGSAFSVSSNGLVSYDQGFIQMQMYRYNTSGILTVGDPRFGLPYYATWNYAPGDWYLSGGGSQRDSKGFEYTFIFLIHSVDANTASVGEYEMFATADLNTGRGGGGGGLGVSPLIAVGITPTTPTAPPPPIGAITPVSTRLLPGQPAALHWTVTNGG